MPGANLDTIMTLAGYKVPPTVNVAVIDPALRDRDKLTQLRREYSNIASCFFPVGNVRQGCPQMAYSAGIRINMTAYSGRILLFRNLM